MLKSLFIFIVFSCSTYVFSQDYSYSFKGSVTPEKESSLIEKIESSKGVEYCKLRYKADSERGELMLVIEKKTTHSEDQDAFSPSDIKAILIEHQLEPIEFRTIK